MWYKNLRVFYLDEIPDLSEANLDKTLANKTFSPCSSLDMEKTGWVAPLGREGTLLYHVTNGFVALSLKRQEKVIPAAVIKEALEDKVAAIQSEEARGVGRSERQTLKDEVIFDLLPKALAKSALECAYIDPTKKLLITASAGAKRAEALVTLLRESLGSLKATPLAPSHNISEVMTAWLRQGHAATGFTFGNECELRQDKDGRVVRLKNQDLSDTILHQHLDSGLRVSKLALSWQEAIEFVLDDEFTLKRIKYADSIYEKADQTDIDSQAAAFDNDLAVMSLEHRALVSDLLHAFGGRSQH